MESLPDASQITLSLPPPKNKQLGQPESSPQLQLIQTCSTSIPSSDPSPTFDRGYSWLIMSAALLINCCSWGLNASFSVFLNYYLTHNSFKHASALDYNFICGIAYGLGQAASPLAIYICEWIPHRIVILIGSTCLAASYIGGSYTTSITGMYLTLGFLQGIGICLVYIPSNALVPMWFKKKLGLANGIAMAGTGIGGVAFTLVAQYIVSTMGVNWAMRILGIAASAGCALAGLFCKSQDELPVISDEKEDESNPSEQPASTKSQVWDARIFKRVDLICLILWCSLGNFANSIALFAMSSFATSIGLSASQGSVISACTCVGSIVGRPILGLLLDRYGNFNMSLLYTFVSMILVFALWIPTHGFAMLVILCLLLGNFLSFSAVSPSPITTSVTDGIPFLAIYNVTWSAVGVLSVFSVPAVMALRTSKLPNSPFLYSQIFTGVCFLVAFTALLFAREYKVRQTIVAANASDGASAEPDIMTPDTLYEQDLDCISDMELPTQFTSAAALEGATPCAETEGQDEATDYFAVKSKIASIEDPEPPKSKEMPGFWTRLVYLIKV